MKLWLWKNFVDGKPEYWAFDNPFPVHMDCDDPQTLGEPCGYAIFKESRNGRPDVTDSEVMRRIGSADHQGAMMEWKPIETAPKNGFSRLYRINGFCVQGFIDVTGALMVQSEISPHWRMARGTPTHWMPLPNNPT